MIHETVNSYEEIFFSAGKVGYQVEVSVKDIEKVVRYTTADICTE